MSLFDLRSGVDALLIGSWIVLLWLWWVQVMIGSFGVGIAVQTLALLLMWGWRERESWSAIYVEKDGSKVALRVMIIPCIKMLLHSTLEWFPLFVPWFKKPIDCFNCFFLFPSDSSLLFMVMVPYGVLTLPTASNIAPLWWPNSHVMPLSTTYLPPQNSNYLLILLFILLLQFH